ncbi:MAG: YwmB family TATA-box binding protein [Bacillota bacterium]|nr:YwmB family TATA-box binding protein [Bacillota bacterium]MDP4169909.1 YwmB family TATA-box binding protein [Bacillota bacterium]
MKQKIDFAKFFLSIIAIVGFIMFQSGNTTTVAEGRLDLLKLASVLQSENIMLGEWTLHAREHLENLKNQKELKNYADDLKQKFPEWKWSDTSTRQKWEVTAVSPTDENRQETIQLMATRTNQKPDAYIVYRVSGTTWNKTAESFFTHKQFGDRLTDIFRGKPTIFSCIKGIVGDKMFKALPNSVNNVLSDFNAKEIEALKEDTFMSVTAYSPMFTESLTSKKGSMNLQVAVRSERLGGRTTIVVGTPIITIEY